MFKPRSKPYWEFGLYILLSYGLIWLAIIFIWSLDLEFTYDPRQFVGKFILLATLTPMLAALVCVRLFRRREGFRTMLRRAFTLRFNPLWLLPAILIPLLVTVLSHQVYNWINGTRIPINWYAPDFPILLVLLFLLVNGLGEELGWRGYALSWLQQRLGPLKASLVLGVFWTFWHTPLFVVPGTYQYGDSTLLYLVFIVSLSVIMTFLVNKANGSVLVAILFHETVNYIAFVIPHMSAYIYWVYAVVAVVCTAIYRRDYKLHGD